LNLRDRARTLLQGLTASPPSKAQTYNVACPEGHRLRGQRTVGYQALRCPTCGEGIFVLPRSPLPEPPVPASGPRDRSAPGALAGQPRPEAEPEPIVLTDPVVREDPPGDHVDGAVIWDDENETATPRTDQLDPVDAGLAEIAQADAQRRRGDARQVPSGRRPGGKAGKAVPVEARTSTTVPAGSRQRVRQAGAGDSATATAPATAAEVRERLMDWVRRRRNLLLFLGVVLLIAATVGFRQWRQYRQDLPRIAALGREEGLAALDEGEFDKAYQLLSRARHAVDALGGAVEGAAQIRQGAAEAEIFVSLVSDRLETILDAAGRTDPKEWERQFATLYKGRSIIVDARIIATPETSGQPRYELDYLVLPDGEGKPLRVARIDTTGFRLFELSGPKVGDQVTFGARLAGFSSDGQSQEWRIALEPQSGVYLTHTRALEALGWPSFAEPSAKEGEEP
jgi:hypothetical protein